MLSKRTLGFELRDVQPRHRFRRIVADLLSPNASSGERAATLFNDARVAVVSNVRDLANVGATRGRHRHRNRLSILLKKSKWPQPDEAQARVWNARLDREELTWVPVLLPNELPKAILVAQSRQRGTLFREDGAMQWICRLRLTLRGD